MIKEFYKENEFHKCRFCGVDIQNLVKKVIAQKAQKADGSWIDEISVNVLMPNALFAQAEIPLRNDGKFTFNGCIQCVPTINSKDFMKVCKNDANMLQYMHRSIMRPKLAKHKLKCYNIEQLSKLAQPVRF